MHKTMFHDFCAFLRLSMLKTAPSEGYNLVVSKKYEQLCSINL